MSGTKDDSGGINVKVFEDVDHSEELRSYIDILDKFDALPGIQVLKIQRACDPSVRSGDRLLRGAVSASRAVATYATSDIAAAGCGSLQPPDRKLVFLDVSGCGGRTIIPYRLREGMQRMIEASCHCGAVHLKIEVPPSEVTECNCSICRRYGVM